MKSLADSSVFHHILPRPSSGPLSDFTLRGVNYSWSVLPRPRQTFLDRNAGLSSLERSPGSDFPGRFVVEQFHRNARLASTRAVAGSGGATHVAMLVFFMGADTLCPARSETYDLRGYSCT